MGVLKLSVIEEQNKQLKNRLRVVGQKGHIVRISNCYCPCECFIREGEVTMCDDVASAGSWNMIKESLIKGEPLFNTLASLILRLWKL